MLTRQGKQNVQINFDEEKGTKQKMSDELVLELAEIGARIEEHYKKPMDIEWALEKDKLFIVQARPITTLEKKGNLGTVESNSKILLKGLAASPGVISGKVKVVPEIEDIEKVKTGDILVTKMTNPDMVVSMQKSAAIVTDDGGLTAHAAIVSREMGIPCVVGTQTATKTIKTGDLITVDCSQGETGRVYDGQIDFEIKKTDISNLEKTKTKILMNCGEPSNAFNLSFIPNDGVGLARGEFIIANSIKIHRNRNAEFFSHKQQKIFVKYEENFLLQFFFFCFNRDFFRKNSVKFKLESETNQN
jgi:pyruvate,water dikinase